MCAARVCRRHGTQKGVFAVGKRLPGNLVSPDGKYGACRSSEPFRSAIRCIRWRGSERTMLLIMRNWWNTQLRLYRVPCPMADSAHLKQKQKCCGHRINRWWYEILNIDFGFFARKIYLCNLWRRKWWIIGRRLIVCERKKCGVKNKCTLFVVHRKW